MNVLYVGDNRSRPNWGCRATSIALSQLLLSKFKVSEVIPGTCVSNKLPVDTFFSQQLLRLLPHRIKKTLSFDFYSWLEKTLGKKTDFITEDPIESSKNLLKYRNKYELLEFIYQSVKACDAIVINGEGDIIFTSPPRRKLLFLLALIELASYLNKPVFYLNAMVSDCPVMGRNQKTVSKTIQCLEKCRVVALRDPISLAIVNAFQANINAKFIPDALFSWQHYFLERSLPQNGDFIIPFPEASEYFGKFDFSEPYVCIGGSGSFLATENQEKADYAYLGLVKQMKDLGKNIFLVETGSKEDFLKTVSVKTGVPLIPINIPILMAGSILANASLFISGRYHPSIFASLGGTPCLFLGSNSHKTKSLQEVLEYKEPKEFSVLPTSQECEEIFYLAKTRISEGDKIRATIKEVVQKRAEESKKAVELIEI